MADADCVVILTDHAGIDYARIVEHASLVFDTRNATRVVADPHGKILRL
jgi:UDP-N-acetyl-D-glucosamine dehydrogenase